MRTKTTNTAKSEKIISEFFKPYFKKHPQLDSIWFLIYDLDDGIYDCGVNGLRRDELSDQKMYDSSYKIQDAIELLEDSTVDVTHVIAELKTIVSKLQSDADDCNPLNKIMDDVWNDDVRNKLSKKVVNHLSKEIPWKYVDWCHCNVNRDGSVDMNVV